MDNSLINLAAQASAEIKSQRQYIERLEVKAQAYETIVAIARNLPRPSQGFGEDVAWKLDEFVRSHQGAASQPKSKKR